MNTTLTLTVAVLALGAASPPLAQPSLYSASSKAQGTPFDISVMETKRDEVRSFLSVPGFHTRTAAASRWLMCAYTDLTIKRGFAYWSVLYPVEGNEQLIAAFSNSEHISPKDLFGPEYAEERVIGTGMMPVEKLTQFCGLRRQPP